MTNYEISTYLLREPAFTDMYTQRLLGVGRAPQWTLHMSAEQQEQWRTWYLEVRASSRKP